MDQARDFKQPRAQLRNWLKMRVVDLLDAGGVAPGSAAARAEWEDRLLQNLKSVPDDLKASLAQENAQQLVREILDDVVGLGPLDALLSDPSVSEIMVNGYDHIFTERNGRIERVQQSFTDNTHLMRVIERMLSSVGRAVSETDPLCDATLASGARINAIIPPLVMNGPVLTIRKKVRDWTLDELVQIGMLSVQAAEFLSGAVRAKVNCIVSGGTSTGKTTLVTALCANIPPDERIITIENVPELELPNRENWVRMVAKSANVQGKGEIPLRELVKNALRMRPDRIILGEARGGEALDVVQAMQSGHDGFMTVLHANTPLGALERMETLMLMSGLDVAPSVCRRQIAGALDLVIHVGRFADGSRRISSIAQVMGNTQEAFQLEALFSLDAQGFSSDGKLEATCRYTGVRPQCLQKFALNNVAIPAWMKTAGG
jgi:pilus assembly protein CpaF